MLQRFGLVLVESPFVAEPPPASGGWQRKAEGGASRATYVSLEEAQARVPFHIPTPDWLPEGVSIRGVADDAGPLGVSIAFGHTDRPQANGTIQLRPGHPKGGIGVAATQAQYLLVNGQPTVYARGTWDRSAQWNSDSDSSLLSWDDDHFTYVLSLSGFGLTRDDTVRIAESLR